MLKLIFSLLLIILIQGCTTFKIGELESQTLKVNSNNKYTPSKDLPVVVQYYKTLGMDSESETHTTKTEILRSVSDALGHHQVNFIDNYDDMPNEYIHIYVIQDIAHDKREGDYFTGRIFLAVLSGFSVGIIPTIDIDTENYVRISHIKDSNPIKSKIYVQDNRSFMSLLFLPLAPFFISDYSLSDTIHSSIREYF